MKRAQRLLVFWSILWTIAFPLIHTHPAHAHGETGHPRPLTHTVFSADLPDEYEHHHDGNLEPRLTNSQPIVSHSDQAHPEIGFSVLTLSSDRKINKTCLLCLISWADHSAPIATARTLTTRVPIAPPALILLNSSLSLRAPPVTTT